MYGSRTGSSGGFGLGSGDDSYGGFADPDGGVTYGGNEPAVPEKVLRQRGGKAFYRAYEVIQGKRMHGFTCTPGEDGTKLAASVEPADEFADDYAVSALIDENHGEILTSDCTCPAYGRFGTICKHVIALIMQYNDAPQSFEELPGFIKSSAAKTSARPQRKIVRRTSRALRSFMQQEDSQLQEKAKSRQLELLKEVSSRASGDTGSGVAMSRHMPIGSVTLRPMLEHSGNDWYLRLHISVPSKGISYVVKDVRALVAAVQNREFVTYGKKLAFVHSRDSFDERSRSILAILGRAIEIRKSVSGDYEFYQSKAESQEMRLSDDEMAELLDLFVDADATVDYVPPRSWQTSSIPIAVVDGDPDLGLAVESANASNGRDSASGSTDGYVIRHGMIVDNFIVGRTSSYVVVHQDPRSEVRAANGFANDSASSQHKSVDDSGLSDDVFSTVRTNRHMSDIVPEIHRCSRAFVDHRSLLSVLCGADERGDLYLSGDDIKEFSRTILPALDPVLEDVTDAVSGNIGDGASSDVSDGASSSANPADDESLTPSVPGASRGTSRHGIAVKLPPELIKMRRVPCVIETYLDRDRYGITCDIQARYGDDRFHVFTGIGPNEPIARDHAAERLAVEAARHYFPVPQGPIARIKEDNDKAIYKLLNEGLPVLRGLGEVYSTPSFDGLTSSPHPVFKIGLSIKSDLVEISPIADEIDPSEVPALLNSYRKRRKFHRLRNGAFVNMADVDTSKLDEVSADLGLKPVDLDSGSVTVPAYEAYYLDGEADDADKSDEFRSYLNDLRVVNPETYQIPAALSKVLRPYQVEGFRWLNAVCDKGFGGILADEMGLGKTVQMLSLLVARESEQRKVGPSLIVCPASLVYNWAAECAKFAPSLKVEALAGSKASRRAILKNTKAWYQGKKDSESSSNSASNTDLPTSNLLLPADQQVEDSSVSASDDDGWQSATSPQLDIDADDTAMTTPPDVLITSYDLLRRDIEDYDGLECYCMVLDEAQYIKNHATKSARAVRKVNALHRFALTGTPIENRLSELWSIFDFLMPGMLGAYKHFRDRFEMPIMSGDEDAQRKLQAFVGPFILRRLKSQVLKDLPDKIENVITVQLEGEQRRLYAALEQQLRATLNKQRDIEFKTGKIQVLAQLTRLRQACCDPRLLFSNVGSNVVKKDSHVWGAPSREVERADDEPIDELSETTDASANAIVGNGDLSGMPQTGTVTKPRKVSSAKLDAIEELVSSCQDAGRKMLIFSQFTSFLDLIAERLRKNGVAYNVITGATPKRKRLELVDRFNTDDIPVFLISLKAGNTGLNLTGACVVVHADPWWNAAAQNQATDRAHRIGQTQDVNVYQIVAKDTIEERILKMQQSKSDLAHRFVDNAGSSSAGGISNLTKDDLLQLLG